MNSASIKLHYRYVIAGSGTLVLMACIGLGRLTYPVILPDMKRGLHLTYAQAGLVGAGNSVGYIVGSLIAGSFIRRWGARHIIVCGMLLVGLALGGTGLSQTYIGALCAQLIAGVGVGIACVGIMSIPASWFVSRSRGRAAGIMGTGTGIGSTAMGLVLPHVLISYGNQGWRLSWYIVGSIVMLLSAIVFLTVREKPEDIGLRPLTSVPAMAGGRGGKEACFSATLWILCLIQLGWGIAYAIYYTFFVIRLTDGVGMGLEAAASIWSVMNIVSICSGVLGGLLSDLMGRRWGMAVVLSALMVSCAGIALSGGSPGFYFFGIIGGLAFNGLPPGIQAVCQDQFEQSYIPTAIGYALIFSALGQFIGPWSGGVLVDTLHSFTWVYMVAALLFAAAAALSLALRRLHRPHFIYGHDAAGAEQTLSEP